MSHDPSEIIVIVTNLVRGFPSARHQMLPSSYIDSYTTTVACHPGLHFPSSIALITHTAATNQTHFISHGLPLSDREYCLAVITVSAIATLRSHSEFPESSLALFIVCLPVSWSLPVISSCLISACPEVYSQSWIYPLPCCFGMCLHLTWTISCLPRTQDYVRRQMTHAYLWITLSSCLYYTFVVVDPFLFYDHAFE